MAKRKREEKVQVSFSATELLHRLAALKEISLPPENWLREDKKRAVALLKRLRIVLAHLDAIEQRLDPVQLPDTVFSLTDPQTIGEVVVHKLLHRQRIKFSDVGRFYGSGVYALYYEGDLEVYEAISGGECPIYVGSAGPDVPTADNPRQQGMRLYGRLDHHFRKSLSHSKDLSAEEFSCRFLVVQSGLEKAAEDFLIRNFQPVWNKESKICSGFGKHGDIARTELSPWDILHGDRRWTQHQTSLKGRTRETIAAEIHGHFRKLLHHNPERWQKYFAQSWIKKRGGSQPLG